MKLSSSSFNVIILFLLLYGLAASQEKPVSIITAANDTLKMCTLDSLTDSLLYITCGSIPSSLPVDSIRTIVLHRESQFWRGAGIGAGAGAIVGCIVGYISYKKPTGPFAFDMGRGFASVGGAVMGATTGFLIGGIVGAVSGSDEAYDLSQRTHKSKVMMIRILLSRSD